MCVFVFIFVSCYIRSDSVFLFLFRSFAPPRSHSTKFTRMHIDAHGPEMHFENAGAIGRCLWMNRECSFARAGDKIEAIMQERNGIHAKQSNRLFATFCDAKL